MPPAGSHWSRPATNSTSTMATQNVGSDWPSTEITWAVRSMALPFFTAAITPSGNAMASDTPIAKSASRSELGRRSLISSMSATEEDYANARRYLGLDRPYVEQYLSFVGKAVTGDLGSSIRARRPVMELLQERLPH